MTLLRFVIASRRSQCIIKLYNSNHMGEKGTMVGGHGWGGEWGQWVGRRGVGVCDTQPQPRYYIALVTPASASAMAPASASAMSLLLSKLGLQEAGTAGMFSAGGMSKIN